MRDRRGLGNRSNIIFLLFPDNISTSHNGFFLSPYYYITVFPTSLSPRVFLSQNPVAAVEDRGFDENYNNPSGNGPLFALHLTRICHEDHFLTLLGYEEFRTDII